MLASAGAFFGIANSFTFTQQAYELELHLQSSAHQFEVPFQSSGRVKWVETKSTAHGWSSSESKLHTVLFEAETYWTLFRKPEKHAPFLASKSERSAME